MKDAAMEADKQKGLKEVAEATVKDNDKVVENTEEQMRAAERARTLAEQKVAETKIKLGGIKLKLAEAESLNLANIKEIAKMKATLEASEDKWYNIGFCECRELC